IELNIFRTAQIRAGIKKNLAATVTSSEAPVMSVGAGLSPFGIHLDLAYAASQNDHALAVQLGFQF
ncbi:MAG: hypothetical protein OEY07_19550, partial [Gammaproteobacteria bacterium]|nr:hypothetical protein [Gammaproteobacteria bacterium]